MRRLLSTDHESCVSPLRIFLHAPPPSLPGHCRVQTDGLDPTVASVQIFEVIDVVALGLFTAEIAVKVIAEGNMPLHFFSRLLERVRFVRCDPLLFYARHENLICADYPYGPAISCPEARATFSATADHRFVARVLCKFDDSVVLSSIKVTCVYRAIPPYSSPAQSMFSFKWRDPYIIRCSFLRS